MNCPGAGMYSNTLLAKAEGAFGFSGVSPASFCEALSLKTAVLGFKPISFSRY